MLIGQPEGQIVCPRKLRVEWTSDLQRYFSGLRRPELLRSNRQHILGLTYSALAILFCHILSGEAIREMD